MIQITTAGGELKIRGLHTSYRRILFVGLLVILWMVNTIQAFEKSRDFYRILGVPRTATPKQIKKRYRELSKEYHPDSNPDASPQQFLDIRDAHEILSNQETRDIYDKYGEAGLDPNNNANAGGFPGGFPGGFHGGFSGGSFFRTGSGGSHFVFTTSGGGGGGGGDGNPFKAFFTGDGFDFGGEQNSRQHQNRQKPQDLYPSETSNVLKLSSSNWENEVTKRDFIILINFYNPSCSPCVNFKTTYEKLATSFKDVLSIAAVNCAESTNLCNELGIQSLPTLLLYTQSGTIKYKGERTDTAIKKWMNQHIPIGGDLLTTNTFEQWITSKPELPKVIFFTDKSVVPMLIRATFHEFRNRVSMGIVLLGTPAGKRLEQEKLRSWDKQGTIVPVLPALLHITNIDTLEGESVSLTSQSKTVLSLLLSRIVAQKRSGQGAYSAEHGSFRELTSRRYQSGECGATEGQICLLLLVFGPASPQASIYRTILDVAQKFAKDPIKFYWVDANQQAEFAAAFGFSPALEGCESSHECNAKSVSSSKMTCEAVQNRCFLVVAYRPKRKKYKVNSSSDVEMFVDSILNGGAPLIEKLNSIPRIH